MLFSLQFIDSYKDGVIFCSVYRFVQRWCLSLILFVQVLSVKSTCCYKQTRGRTPSPTCVIDGATFQEDTRWNCSWEYVFWGIFLHFLVLLQFLYFFHITVKLCSHMKLFFPQTLNDVTELDTKYATGNIQLHKLLTILLLMSCRYRCQPLNPTARVFHQSLQLHFSMI